ncbi:substrate-binding and VWA domain-containing protein [Streptomyces phyllanthi]|uniref:VWA domain-containing protein n=1 Tax=Streptomyces phyllanthi TaxID=1803180 RepID=A0A5N8WDG5_9ACTN|nr:substrate-binding and VWA domain-containing protein [Streptomyces phyllanthi]MPY45182.1 VWA domain-containing protein [Streptomyces phyllanthi]
MGRHSLPDPRKTGVTDPRARARRRTLAATTALALTVAAGAVAVVHGGLLAAGSSCRDKAVRLSLAASPDIAPALEAAADRARKDGTTSDGRCLDVRVTARDSYRVASELRSGAKPDAQVWVPDSDVWVQRVTSDAAATPLSRAGSVASSPVGVAVIPSVAKSLGWPDRTYTWDELAGAALKDDRPRLGAADPSRSATGLLALTRLTSATAGTKKGAIQAVTTSKRLSRHTVESDSRILDTIPPDMSGTGRRDDSTNNQALILSEQHAYAYNALSHGGDRLRLFYPKDGSPRLDYPFVLVDESQLSTDTSRAALRFMITLNSEEGRGLLAERGFRTQGAAAKALVRQAGGRAPQPYADDPPEPASTRAVQETLGIWTVTVQSARLTAVVDVSASMTEPVPGAGGSRMDVTRASLFQSLATFEPDDEYGVWQFSTKLDGGRDYAVVAPTRRLGDRVGAGTHRDRLTAAFNDLRPVPGGATGLYDTTLAAYREAVTSYVEGRFNGIVVLTDGVNEDPDSISRSTLVSELRKARDPDRPVGLIMIAVGPEADKDELEEIALSVGGSGHRMTDPSQVHAVILSAIVQAGSFPD